jgi:hemolysin activation/secretion protein
MRCFGKSFTYLALFAVQGFLNPIALAQVPDAGALQQQLERQLPDASPLPTPGPKERPKEKPKNQDERKIEVKDFRFQGNTLFSDEKLRAVLEPWVNRSLTISELEEVTNAISDFYRLEDYVARVVVPEQDATDGTIMLQLIEVKIDKIIIARGEQAERVRMTTDRAGLFLKNFQSENDFLKIDALQHGLMVINELSGVNLEGVIEPSDTQGEVNFVGRLIDTPVFAGKIEASNFGSRSTGIPQMIGALSVNDYWGQNSLISLTGIASEGSSYGRLSTQRPFGYSGFGMGLSTSYLDYHTVGIYNTNGARGNSSTYGINAYYPLLRGAQSNMNLLGGFDYKNYLNLTSTPYSVISDSNLQNFYMGANGNFYDSLNALSYWSISLTLGDLKIANEEQRVGDQNSANTEGNFKKLSFAYNRYQSIIGDQTTLLMSISGQLASTNLNSAEQFYLGGPNGVRAYPVAQGSGSQGFITTLELQQKVPSIDSTAFAFFDMGQVQQYKFNWPGWQGLTEADNTYRLYGAGFGMRYAKGNTQINATLAWPIGNNPLHTYTGAAVNNDGRQLNPQGWIQGLVYF